MNTLLAGFLGALPTSLVVIYTTVTARRSKERTADKRADAQAYESARTTYEALVVALRDEINRMQLETVEIRRELNEARRQMLTNDRDRQLMETNVRAMEATIASLRRVIVRLGVLLREQGIEPPPDVALPLAAS